MEPLLLDQGVKDNLVRWTRGRAGHVESFFLKANHPSRPLAIWLKFTIFSPKGNPDDAVAENDVLPNAIRWARALASKDRATLGKMKAQIFAEELRLLNSDREG